MPPPSTPSRRRTSSAISRPAPSSTRAPAASTTRLTRSRTNLTAPIADPSLLHGLLERPDERPALERPVRRLARDELDQEGQLLVQHDVPCPAGHLDHAADEAVEPAGVNRTGPPA